MAALCHGPLAASRGPSAIVDVLDSPQTFLQFLERLVPPLGIAQAAFPECDHSPAQACKLCPVTTVPSTVSIKIVASRTAVRTENSASLAAVPVPMTAVNEDYCHESSPVLERLTGRNPSPLDGNPPSIDLRPAPLLRKV